MGYHIPTEVVAQVCSHYGIRLDSSGRLVGEQDSEQLFMQMSQKGKPAATGKARDQVTINTEAKEIIRDLFPQIPDNDLFQIIKTAFQLGDRKVGTAEEIPLVRRAQLSVVAHIRHSYTKYDTLLRQLPYNEARHTVEKPTLAKLIEWRGDENDKSADSKNAVDEAVREVVVLSDEESSDSELEEGQVLENEHLKVEPVRKQAQPVISAEHRPLDPAEASSGEEAPTGYRYVTRSSRKQIPLPMQSEYITRQQQSRYALWDQVRHEYQSNLHTRVSNPSLNHTLVEPQSSSRATFPQREIVYERMPPAQYVADGPEPVSELSLGERCTGNLYQHN